KVAALIGKAVLDVYVSNRKLFGEAFPDLRDVDLQDDLFAQNNMAESVVLCEAQAEEVFSDFIGMLLFREWYLYAFHYLVSPTLTGARSPDYPATRARAEILA